ncbi:MAG: hypothetical protein OET44_10775 [Gammaproteobacteria bacterium]|nr:hypothetical protein [Gammaproteobacteria bacterium]
MTTKTQTRLIVPARYATAPEFRAAHNTFGRAYSGPEQRQRTPPRLSDDSWPHTTRADGELPDAVF